MEAFFVRNRTAIALPTERNGMRRATAGSICGGIVAVILLGAASCPPKDPPTDPNVAQATTGPAATPTTRKPATTQPSMKPRDVNPCKLTNEDELQQILDADYKQRGGMGIDSVTGTRTCEYTAPGGRQVIILVDIDTEIGHPKWEAKRKLTGDGQEVDGVGDRAVYDPTGYTYIFYKGSVLVTLQHGPRGFDPKRIQGLLELVVRNMLERISR
jgi:hypothetical protein